MKNVILLFSLLILFSCGGKKKNGGGLSSTQDTSSTKNTSNAGSASAWEVRDLLDEFGTPSGEKCLYSYLNGKFSNSATSGSDLYVEILFTSKKAGILLHEYNPDKPAASFIGGGGVLKMRNQAGVEISISLSGDWAQTGGLALKGSSYTKFKDYLASSNGDIICIVKDKYSSVYNFTIDPTGFSTLIGGIK